MRWLRVVLWRIAADAFALTLLAGSAWADPAGGKIALVVGNGGYKNVAHLVNPTNDARLIARTLQGLGFELVGGGPQLDLDKAAFDNAVQTFGKQLQGAQVALFYYAGHGLQADEGNWLVPVDANPTRAQDLDFQTVNAALVLKQMEGSGTKLNLMILDACRNNPFAGRGLRAAGGGLAQMATPEGTLISYATQPGAVAQDGRNADSPYTEALAEAMRRPGLDLFGVFNEVGLKVKQTTGGAQQPWVASSPIDGAFYFVAAAQPAPAPVVRTAPPSSASADPQAMELAFWNSVKDSKSADDYREYLRKYPQGNFAGLARNRIKQQEPPAPPAPDRKVAAVTPPPGVPGKIVVRSATLGGNCGVSRGNVTAKVAEICDGRTACSLPGSKVNNPDPAYGCAKMFAAEWQCSGKNGTNTNSVAASAMETNVLTLSCQ
jgi:hypothetical protein